MDKLSDEMLRPVRGARDFSGEEKASRDFLTSWLRRKFEVYGFRGLETPALERLEVLSSKFAGGEGILDEVFKVTDQGGRQLGLRYDLTVPLCRFIAANPRMQLPFKRYAIASVWRDGPLKAGRYREFSQCDADTVGATSMLADAEILKLASAAFDELFPGNYEIRVSNRKILDGILECAGIQKQKWLNAIISIDKLEKIGKIGVEEELTSKGIQKSQVGKIMEMIQSKGTNAELMREIGGMAPSEVAAEGLRELQELLTFCEDLGLTKRIKFQPSLARGLNYYTSTVFEAFLIKSAVSSSIAAGGRYDDLIGKFAGLKERIPAVGISFGLDVMAEALAENKDRMQGSLDAEVFVVPILQEGGADVRKFALSVLCELRKAGVTSGIDLIGRNAGKNLEFASKRNVKYAAMIGGREMQEGKVLLKNLETGEGKLLGVPEVLKEIRGLGARST